LVATSRTFTFLVGLPPMCELALLQGAHQLWLDLQRYIPNLIQKQRALVRNLQLAASRSDRAGKRRLFMVFFSIYRESDTVVEILAIEHVDANRITGKPNSRTRPSCGHLDLERNRQAWASGTMVRSGPPAP